MSLNPVSVIGIDAGLQKNKKPFLLIDSAFQKLSNAFAYRGRIKKRDGIKLVGRLRRELTAVALTVTAPAVQGYGFVFADFGITDANAEIEPGSLVITVAAPDAATFTDNGDGTFTVTGKGNATGSFVNYATGDVLIFLDLPVVGGAAITADINYFPGLPVMGIDQREQVNINAEQTAFFDTKYVYRHDGNDFESPSTTTWAGDDSEFFWMANYRGATADERLFFVTNFAQPNLSTDNRIRYTANLSSWTDFTPAVDSTNFIWQCRLIIAYYGRLLFFNTWEGVNTAGAVNFFNRCRFSQVGNPIQVDAWRSDIFGKGGFIDAPTSESIISCRFYKNVLIVFFERSTWLLRYVGEYGLPFIWERISSDFGSESMLSTVLFDKGILAVGDKAIIASSGNDAERIDLDIPDQVFEFKNEDEGHARVHGIRDFQKEVVYWCYPDGSRREDYYFPSNVLVYNYRNNTWAQFRDNVTAFGILQVSTGDSWDEPIPWDSNTSWDFFTEPEFPLLVSGNQQGYIHFYQYNDTEVNSDSTTNLIESESLSITAITLSDTVPIEIEVRNHNLDTGEVIYIVGLQFLDTATSTVVPTDLNDRFYSVEPIDTDNLRLFRWNIDDQEYESTERNVIDFTPAVGAATYIGGGQLALIPVMAVETKDFNPLQSQGKQIKMTHVDFQTDATPNSSITVSVYINSSEDTVGNLEVGNKSVETAVNQFGIITNATQTNPCVITSPNHGILTGESILIRDVNGMTDLNDVSTTITFINVNSFSLDGVDATGFGAYTFGGQWMVNREGGTFYVAGSNYAWHRFFATCFGQYINLLLTYDDQLMNETETHQSPFELNAINLYFREGGRTIF